MYNQKFGVSLLLFCCFFLLFINVVYAHRMLIEPLEEGVVKVVYEDGRFSRRTEVVVYNANNKEIARGPLDGDGLFYYPADAHLIVADDGLGHRVQWQLGEDTSELPRAITVSLVVLGLALIAGIFEFRIKRK